MESCRWDNESELPMNLKNTILTTLVAVTAGYALVAGIVLLVHVL